VQKDPPQRKYKNQSRRCFTPFSITKTQAFVFSICYSERSQKVQAISRAHSDSHSERLHFVQHNKIAGFLQKRNQLNNLVLLFQQKQKGQNKKALPKGKALKNKEIF
jgi:hypothetical protein